MVPSETRIAKSFLLALLDPILNVNKSMKASVVEVRPIRATHEKATLYTDMYLIHYFSRNTARRELFL